MSMERPNINPATLQHPWASQVIAIQDNNKQMPTPTLKFIHNLKRIMEDQVSNIFILYFQINFSYLLGLLKQ
mgnify:CR=1 FL=1|tara:strand:- start:537 stop:752 length:216 start_codon:yes stop_codon:yes gene_type:complete